LRSFKTSDLNDDIEDFLELIKAGENSRIEFKSVQFHSDSLAKEAVAFANMKGGEIFYRYYR